MLYILHGPDRFSLREALEGLKEDLGAGDLASSNTTVREGKQLSLQELLALCDTAPFLAPHRLVVVEGLLGRFEPRDRSVDPSEARGLLSSWLPLKDYLPRMPHTTILVLVEGRLRGNNPLLRELAPQARVMEFPLLRWLELQDWIRLRVGKAGGGISATAVRLLADLVGAELGVLAGEIEKLCLYAGGRRIEEADIRLLVSHAREASVFSLVDALALRQTTQAMKLLHQLLEGGATGPYLLFMITRQFRFLLRAQEWLARGLPEADIAQGLGLAGYPFQKTIQQARQYSAARLEEVYRELLSTDLSLKTGRRGIELALDLLVADLGQGQAAGRSIP